MAFAEKLNQTLKEFIELQPLFFVATAARDGRVNMSPKGMDSLRVLEDNRIVWLNFTGSGNETAAHIADLPRMTLMFTSFAQNPLILRVYGTARAIHPRDADWQNFSSLFARHDGNRQFFDLDIELVQTSCGFGVPVMDFVKDRANTRLVPHFEKKGREGILQYWQNRNAVSIDGAPTRILGEED